jgi:hypothetical protein
VYLLSKPKSVVFPWYQKKTKNENSGLGIKNGQGVELVGCPTLISFNFSSKLKSISDRQRLDKI